VSLKGQPWGRPATGPADVEVAGDDAALARAVEAHPGALVRFAPDAGSDLARAVGLDAAGEPAGLDAPVDALACDPGGLAVNAVVLGTPPGRLRAWSRSGRVEVSVDGRVLHDGPATTVVIANGQFLDGLDVVPRGHPGDGRIEVQVYALGPGERRAMRARLPLGTHLPHPRIATASGRAVTVHADRRRPLALDGVARDPVGALAVTVRPAALRLVL
jgi:YegS C-terminal NAD kinase beta sandwich-like domain